MRLLNGHSAHVRRSRKWATHPEFYAFNTFNTYRGELDEAEIESPQQPKTEFRNFQ